MENNNILSHKIIHFIGIAGISMRTIAEILGKSNKITGTDKISVNIDNCETFMEDGLVHIPDNVDFVVYHSDIPHSNVEYKFALDNNIPLYHRSKILDLMCRDRFKFAITGCSGKTSTTYYLHNILTQLELDPFSIIGEKIFPQEKCYMNGKGPYIIEINEADMKFHLDRADILIFTKYGLDHVWMYESEDHLIDYYVQFMNNCKIVCYYEENPAIIKAKQYCKNTQFIKHNGEITNLALDWKNFTIKSTFKFQNHDYTTSLLGIHSINNLINSLGAASLKYDISKINCEIISHCHRRSEIIFKRDNLLVIDDQGLSAEEMNVTISAMSLFNKPMAIIMDPYRDIRCNFFLEEYKILASKYYSCSRYEQINPTVIMKTKEDLQKFLQNFSEGIIIIFHKFNHELRTNVIDILSKFLLQ